MNVTPKDMALYAVTDSQWVGDMNLAQQVEAAIQGGATCIQLREKHLSVDALVQLAVSIKCVTDSYRIPFVINDSVEVALKANADGVHLGQGDLNLHEARRRLGPHKIIGISVHSVDEAIAAQNNGADYIGVGAAFPTTTKSDAKPLSPAIMRSITDAVSIPVVAIGGIDMHTMSLLKETGIKGVAVVSALFSQPDIKQAAKKLKALSVSLFQNHKSEGVNHA